MAARSRPSKRRSDANSKSASPRETDVVFFLDRDLGRFDVADALRAKGAVVEVHADNFHPDVKDSEWLKIVGERGWIVLTKDRHILTRLPEIVALLEARVFAFILKQRRSEQLSGDRLAQAFVSALPHMRRLINSHTPPFLARVTPAGNVTEIEGYKKIQQRILKHRTT